MNLTELNKVRNHDFHKYLGIKQIDAEAGKAIVELEVKKHILNPGGTFHGGVIYTLCDITAFCALISQLAEKEIGVTNHFSIQVMRAVTLGATVKFEAKIIKLGKRLAFLESEAYSSGKLIAKATVTKTLLRL